MILWKDLLKPISTTINHQSSLHEAMELICNEGDEVVFVKDNGTIVGYFNHQELIKQIVENGDLQKRVEYQTDVLLVPFQNSVEFFHNVSVVLGIDEHGKVVGYCSLEDARNKLTQLKLQQKSQIFNSARIGVITTDHKLGITSVNEMAENILGLSSRFLMNRNYKTLLAIDKLEDVLNGKQFVNVNNSINFKQIIGNFSPLFNDGKIEGIIHIFHLREQLEEAINELEWVRSLNEDLKAIYSSADEEILVIDSKGEIIRAAGTFLKDFWMLQSSNQLIGKKVNELQQRGFFKQNILEETRKKGKGIFVHENARGRKIWSVATPIFYEDKLEKVVIISRDITEINQLREELEIEKQKSNLIKQELDEMIKRKDHEKKLIYRSKVMENLVEQIKQIASVDSTVLLYGESGVGKEVFAQTIHSYSQRSEYPLIRVNCGAIPENLIESEFFGYEKGAFTGADKNGKPGMFELANQGTIFLDEITELPLNLQVKLLRVLQEREVMRIGGVKSKKVDVRVIAATNRDIKKLIEENKFREDLYYRLNVIPVTIPPLRERNHDISCLSVNFLEQFNATYKWEKALTRKALDVLECYDWPGNVRELQNVIERLVVTTRENSITGEDVMAVLYGESKETKFKAIIHSIVPLKEAVEEVEAQLIRSAMDKYGTAAKAAQVLGISPATISRRINKLFNEGERSNLDVYVT
ncbi:PAS domain S-box protein [Bacillus salipaludis]|uniref:HTH-type transcriptional regulatory protein TyrR n=1 Tax=Bacillus salipaludis TaxID=2547811 RepID=A0A4V6PMC8_9BACI|nr:sigma 54-interacting transcriptional regulator [Bacillus salipaludis]MDQ6595636.1 sigma 54-interacting transcriptional regulator [Bacillus salipaludis]TDK58587.1 PAS domain S-box protein [Bacillus salipaludis]